MSGNIDLNLLDKLFDEPDPCTTVSFRLDSYDTEVVVSFDGYNDEAEHKDYTSRETSVRLVSVTNADGSPSPWRPSYNLFDDWNENRHSIEEMLAERGVSCVKHWALFCQTLHDFCELLCDCRFAALADVDLCVRIGVSVGQEFDVVVRVLRPTGGMPKTRETARRARVGRS